MGYISSFTGSQIDDRLTTGTEALSSDTSKTITHNRGYYPIVQILDSGGNVLDAQITHTNTNQFTVSFTEVQSGTIIFK